MWVYYSVLFCVPPDDAFEEGGNGGRGNGNEEELGDNWNPSREYQVSLLICVSVCVSVCQLVCLPVESSTCQSVCQCC